MLQRPKKVVVVVVEFWREDSCSSDCVVQWMASSSCSGSHYWKVELQRLILWRPRKGMKEKEEEGRDWWMTENPNNRFPLQEANHVLWRLQMDDSWHVKRGWQRWSNNRWSDASLLKQPANTSSHQFPFVITEDYGTSLDLCCQVSVKH